MVLDLQSLRNHYDKRHYNKNFSLTISFKSRSQDTYDILKVQAQINVSLSRWNIYSNHYASTKFHIYPSDIFRKEYFL